MNRRSFLGGVLGTIVSTQLPFKSVLWNAPLQTPRIVPYRVLIWDQIDKMFIQAPGIKKVAFDNLKEAYLIMVENIEFHRTMTIDRSIMIDDKGAVFTEHKFTDPIHVINGDRLVLTNTLSCDKRMSFESTVNEFAKKHNKHISGVSI